MNLGWISYERAEDLFRRLNPDAQDFGTLDPFSVLTRAPRERLEDLAADPSFVARARALLDDLRNSSDVPRWFQHREGSPLRSVAYFSPEFGIAQALPQYSGGLGVLAGDHLKAAADLGIDLSEAWMVGDILDDVEAGNRAGCRTILIDNDNETEWRLSTLRWPTVVVRNLESAARAIVDDIVTHSARRPRSLSVA